MSRTFRSRPPVHVYNLLNAEEKYILGAFAKRLKFQAPRLFTEAANRKAEVGEDNRREDSRAREGGQYVSRKKAKAVRNAALDRTTKAELAEARKLTLEAILAPIPTPDILKKEPWDEMTFFGVEKPINERFLSVRATRMSIFLGRQYAQYHYIDTHIKMADGSILHMHEALERAEAAIYAFAREYEGDAFLYVTYGEIVTALEARLDPALAACVREVCFHGWYVEEGEYRDWEETEEEFNRLSALDNAN